MSRYNPHDIEPRWQAYWAEHKTFKTLEDPALPKYYVLCMFPYPSGAGLHVGHPESYTAVDIVARYKRMRGFRVLNPTPSASRRSGRRCGRGAIRPTSRARTSTTSGAR